MKSLYCSHCNKTTNHYKQHYSDRYPTTSKKDFMDSEESGFFCFICSVCNSQSQYFESIPLKISSEKFPSGLDQED